MSTVAERSAARKRARQQQQTLDWVDDRLGSSSWLRSAMDKIFPDHWSFMVGEIAMYTFVILIATGIYLALFYTASDTIVIYHGAYKPLDGQAVTEAYASTINLSFSVRAGLVIRQAHHWAALDIPGGNCVPHVPGVLYGSVPPPTGNQLDNRGHPVDAGHAGGVLGLFAA